jgi:hypothetical protein
LWSKAYIAGIVALLGLLWLGGASAVAQTTGDGAVQGRIVNVTDGGSDVVQHPIVLNTYQLGAPIDSATATTDDEGRFEFTELTTDADLQYQLTTEYQGAEYSFEAFSFPAGETVHEATLAIYSSTSSDQAIWISRSHVIVNVNGESLEVTEYYQFANGGNTTFIGTRDIAPGLKETLRFSLPREATELTLGGELMDCCIEPVEGGFVDTMIVLPGTKEMLYTYRIENASGSYDLPVTLYYPVDSFDLMVQGKDVDVVCEQLIEGDPLVTEEGQIVRFLGQGLEPYTTLDISLSGLGGGGGGLFSWQGIVILVAAHAAGLFALNYWRRRRRRLAVVTGSAGERADRGRLLQEIADLDDAYERGDIAEEDYTQRRSLLKARLVEMTRSEDA